jgi:hypothetical protein
VAAGDEEVAGPLGGRAREHRRLELHEIELAERAPHVLGHAVAEQQGVALAIAPQVEVAVAHPHELVDLAVLVDRERRRVGVGELVGRGDVELDLACGHLRVDVLGLAGHHRADD